MQEYEHWLNNYTQCLQYEPVLNLKYECSEYIEAEPVTLSECMISIYGLTPRKHFILHDRGTYEVRLEMVLRSVKTVNSTYDNPVNISFSHSPADLQSR